MSGVTWVLEKVVMGSERLVQPLGGRARGWMVGRVGDEKSEVARRWCWYGWLRGYWLST